MNINNPSKLRENINLSQSFKTLIEMTRAFVDVIDILRIYNIQDQIILNPFDEVIEASIKNCRIL
jgi:hypothetical protein